jgi:hypothetical protein
MQLMQPLPLLGFMTVAVECSGNTLDGEQQAKPRSAKQ